MSERGLAANPARADVSSASLTRETGAGISNAYNDKTLCPYLADTLDTGDRNQNLDSCPHDIRIRMRAHPALGPVMVKIEMKSGLFYTLGMNPALASTNWITAPADGVPGEVFSRA